MNATENTKQIISYFANETGWTGSEQYARLHGILCMSHALTREQQRELDKVIDSLAIAARMDEISKYGS